MTLDPIYIGTYEVVNQVLGFGLLFLAAGYLVAGRLFLSPIATVSCLLIGFWLYAVVGVALVYGVPVSNPVPALNLSVLIMLVVQVLFLVLGVMLGKRYEDAMKTNA